MKILTQDQIKFKLAAAFEEALLRGIQGGSPEGEGGEAGEGDSSGASDDSGGESSDSGGDSGGESGSDTTPSDSSSASPSGSEDTSKSGDGSEGKKPESKPDDKAKSKGALSLDDDDSSDVDTPTPVDISLPEDIQVDEQVFAKFKGVFEETAQEHKLSNEQANGVASKLAAWYVQEQLDAAAEVQQTKESMHESWGKELFDDPDLGGGKEDQWKAAEKSIKTGLRKFASKEEAEAIAAAGLGNFPPFVKLMHRVGKAFGEDSSGGANVGGTEPTLTKGEKAKNMYPNSPELHT